jgi:hypothetical protein
MLPFLSIQPHHISPGIEADELVTIGLPPARQESHPHNVPSAEEKGLLWQCNGTRKPLSLREIRTIWTI